MMLCVSTFRELYLTEGNRPRFVESVNHAGIFVRAPVAMHVHAAARRYAARPPEIL